MIDGSIVALITPFTDKNTVNYAKLKELIDFQLLNKTDGLLILGTTAETPTLSELEQDGIVQFVIDYVNKKCQVIVGACSNSTEKSIYLGQKYAKMGADAILVISPYYNKTNDSGMIKHFLKIADSINVPVILYNIPGRTGINISIDVIKKIKNHPNIIGIKEAGTDLGYTTKLAFECNKNFKLIAGNDDLMMSLLALGSTTVMTVFGNIYPNITKEIIRLVKENKMNDALKIYKYYYNFILNLFTETNPIPIKEILNYIGFGVGGLRLPLDNMSDIAKQKLFESYDNLGVLNE